MSDIFSSLFTACFRRQVDNSKQQLERDMKKKKERRKKKKIKKEK
jgi:hypothetical protein